MCGIAGFQGRFDEALLREMVCAVSHRGPDGLGASLFVGASDSAVTGFGHSRLAIIDLSEKGAQPMGVTCAACHSAGMKDLALTYNGEIYNFRELRGELSSHGHRFDSATDSEVLLHLYAQHGPGFVERLNGIFALALRDARADGVRPRGVDRGDVLIARDPIGVKPLYYAETGAGVLFGSEIKALLKSPSVARSLDPHALQQYLAYLWAPAPRTPFRAVRKLPPGHCVVIRDGRVHGLWRYYSLPHTEQYLAGTETAIARELHDAVHRAVTRQTVADVPIGAFLSGGLDSSAVVAMMAKSPETRPSMCYTIGFKGDARMDGSPDDLPYARAVAKHLAVPLEVIEVGADSFELLEKMLLAIEEPQGDPAPINAYLIAKRARANGHKVLLSGAGGDDVFSGYRRHRALQLERYWAWLPVSARRGLAAASRRLGGSGLAFGGSPAGRRLAKAFAYADQDPERRMVSYFWWSDESLRRPLYSRELAAATAGVDTAEPLLATLDRLATERDPLNRMLELETVHFLADHNLNYTDKVGMAYGVEVRVPFLDLELVDLASRIPPRLKYKGRTGKAILKKSMEAELPREVIYRAKTGFGAPVRRWISSELRPVVDDVLSAESVRGRGLFDAGEVARLVARDRAGIVDGAYTIFSLLCIEMWCRLFVDSSPAGARDDAALSVTYIHS